MARAADYKRRLIGYEAATFADDTGILACCDDIGLAEQKIMVDIAAKYFVGFLEATDDFVVD